VDPTAIDPSNERSLRSTRKVRLPRDDRCGSGDELELRVAAKVATDLDARAALAELVADRTR
jgi:hypothetical protein